MRVRLQKTSKNDLAPNKASFHIDHDIDSVSIFPIGTAILTAPIYRLVITRP